MTGHRRGWACVLLSVLAAAQPDAQQAQRFDIVLRNGTILDGSGLPPYRADVAIADGRIARIGKLPRDSAALDLDVADLYVAPGSSTSQPPSGAGAPAGGEHADAGSDH